MVGAAAAAVELYQQVRTRAAEEVVGEEGRGAATRDRWVRVSERAPIQSAAAGAQVGGVRARVRATTANERAEGTQARVEVRVSDWTPIRVATFGAQVEGEGTQAQATSRATTAIGRLETRVEEWQMVAKTRATNRVTSATEWVGERVET